MKALWNPQGVHSSNSRGWTTAGLWALVLASFTVLMLLPFTSGCSIAEDLTVTTTPTDIHSGAPVVMATSTTSVTETVVAATTATSSTETTAATTTTLAPETTVAAATTSTAVTEPAGTTTATESVTTTASESTSTTLSGTEPETTPGTEEPATGPPTTAPPTTVPPYIEAVEPAPTVLYEITDWSAGTSGWAAAGQWKTAGGMLVTDGTSDSFAVAPVDLTDYPDYAIECEVQILDPEKTDVFLLARMINGTGYKGGFDARRSRMVISYKNTKLGYSRFVLDSNWHTYRLEVRGNNIKLFFEQAEVARAIDNRAVEPGTVGIYCGNGQISVRSFRVTAL
jgi:hypothetical protein